jgi:hypothetical protein
VGREVLAGRTYPPPPEVKCVGAHAATRPLVSAVGSGGMGDLGREIQGQVGSSGRWRFLGMGIAGPVGLDAVLAEVFGQIQRLVGGRHELVGGQ